MPEGLRHGYGIHAIGKGIPLNMLQKWMGHAQMETTSIYANAVGKSKAILRRRCGLDFQKLLLSPNIYVRIDYV